MFLKHKGLPSYDIFRHCSTKTFRRKNVIPPSDPQIPFIPDFFWITRIPPTNFFGLVRQRKRNNRDAPLPLPILCMKFFNFRIFRNTEAFPYEFFQNCETKKNQREKRDTFPLSHILASLAKFFWNTRVLPTEVFETVRFSVLLDKKNPTKRRCPPNA